MAESSAFQAARQEALAAEELQRRTIHRRAIEAANWGMPLVNYALMFQAAGVIGAAQNQIVYWSRLSDWRNQTLTPNPDAIYIMPFFDTRTGAMVLDIPPAEGGSITGSVMDCWQTAIEDVGPAGIDKGKGGKYLILPPGQTDAPEGFIPMPSKNFQGYALLRSILKSGADADVEEAVAYARQIKLYPYAQNSVPPETLWHDAIGSIFDATIPYDLRFFAALDHMIQLEPWRERDKVMIEFLRSIGIVKGQNFAPDTATSAVLDDAIGEARAWQEANYDSVFVPPFREGARWAMPASQELIENIECDFTLPDAYPIDARGLAYSYAFFSAKHLGAGQYYLMTIRDADGDPFDGAKTYRLRVPANAPVNQYWSATLYDRATHALIRDVARQGRGSQSPGIQSNADGSVDLFFGPEAPGGQEPNWVPTRPGGKFEVLFRFYGPKPALFDHSWKLPDIGKAF